MKKEFRKPYGRVFSDPERIKSLIKGKKVISVGDGISYRLIKAGIKPDVIIFDKKIGRKPIDSIIENVLESFDAKKLYVKNPPSHITDELWSAVKQSLDSDEKIKIIVDGEEDLAVLPFVLESSVNTIILYGFMNRSFVMIKVNKDLKQKCKQLLSRMERARSSAW